MWSATPRRAFPPSAYGGKNSPIAAPTKAEKLLDQHRMQVSHLFWAGGFTGSDGRSFHESLEDAQEARAHGGRAGGRHAGGL